MPAPEITAAALLRLIMEEGLVEEELGEGSDLAAHGLDSLAMMRLVILIERDFGVRVPPEGMTRARFATAAALALWLTELRARAVSA